MNNGDVNWIVNYIWGIADDMLRDLYVRGKYRDVILPMTVLRRLDSLLEPTKSGVLDMRARSIRPGISIRTKHCARLPGRRSTTRPKFTLRDLKARASQQQLKADFEAYLDGFSPTCRRSWRTSSSATRFPRLSKADALGTLIEKLVSPDLNLSPNPVLTATARSSTQAWTTMRMGTLFEELIRRFNEENNEEAGEHWTPRDAVKLMAKLIFLPIANRLSRAPTSSTTAPAVPAAC